MLCSPVRLQVRGLNEAMRSIVEGRTDLLTPLETGARRRAMRGSYYAVVAHVDDQHRAGETKLDELECVRPVPRNSPAIAYRDGSFGFTCPRVLTQERPHDHINLPLNEHRDVCLLVRA